MQIIDHAVLTHVGLRRELNEDNFAALPERGVWAVADGMGGHEGGEIASEIARDQVMEGARMMRPLRDTVLDAHREIMEHPMAGGDRSMGTTLVAMQAHENGLLEIAWVGDSRAYVLDDEGLTQRSKDQTKVQAWIDEGVLTAEQAKTHPYRNVILQALGIQQEQPLHVASWSGQVSSPTRVLLCSDGLNEHVSDVQIKLLLGAPSCEQAAADLVQAALDGGGSDNITVIVVDLDSPLA